MTYLLYITKMESAARDGVRTQAEVDSWSFAGAMGSVTKSAAIDHGRAVMAREGAAAFRLYRENLRTGLGTLVYQAVRS